MSDIALFVAKKHKNVSVETIEDKIKKLPWYRRPIEKDAFITRTSKNGKIYAHHREWAENIWIGPYASKKDVENVIDAYVKESLKRPLDKTQTNLIHSVFIENTENFFLKNI